MGPSSPELIDTEDLFLVSLEKHARLLRLQRKSDKLQENRNNNEQKVSNCVCKYFLFLQIRLENQLLAQQSVSDLIETENSRLMVMEKHARELRRHKKDLLNSQNVEEELKQKIADINYELEESKEQNAALEKEKDEQRNEVMRLKEDLKNKETLTKGLVDSLLKETNAHQATILQHQVCHLSPNN